ncbi:hypothetical protein [Mesorhizobium loti]|uniref:hypothetical protein n=1 Tax=Rhizobium loti TaxID=381 RepID=UPI00047B31D3|nr:hypothetical protein [Mesorhizobium loti]
MQTCVELKQEESNQGFPWLVATAALLLLILAGGWFFLSWQSGQRYGNVDTILRQLKRRPNGRAEWQAGECVKVIDFIEFFVGQNQKSFRILPYCPATGS